MEWIVGSASGASVVDDCVVRFWAELEPVERDGFSLARGLPPDKGRAHVLSTSAEIGEAEFGPPVHCLGGSPPLGSSQQHHASAATRCGTVCHRKNRRQILRGHVAVSTSPRRPGGRIDGGRATGLPVAPIRLRRRERTDGPRTPTDLREDPRTRNDVQDADESLASWTRHRIGVRQRHRRRITGACAIRLSIFGTA